MNAGHETPPPPQPGLLAPTDVHHELTPAERPESLLDKLRKPWSVSELTESQVQRKKDQIAAKELHDKVLAAYHMSTNPTYERDRLKKIKVDVHKSDEDGHENANNTTTASSNDNNTSITSDSLFSKLPGEVKNMIYEPVLKDHKELQRTRRRPIQLHHWPAGQMSEKGRTSIRKFPFNAEHFQELRKLYQSHVDSQLKQAKESDLTTDGCIAAFNYYKAEHDIRAEEDECWHEMHADGVIYVNQRGNLCDELPNLALTNREIFADMFCAKYLDKRKNLPCLIIASIKYLDFSPLLRFCQMLGKAKYPIKITGSMVHVELSDEISLNKDFLFENRFYNIKRLIELHWLGGLPFWPCLTGSSVAPEEQPIQEEFISCRYGYLNDESEGEDDVDDDDEGPEAYISDSEQEEASSSVDPASREGRIEKRHRAKKLQRAQQRCNLVKEARRPARREQRRIAREQQRLEKESMRYTLLARDQRTWRAYERQHTTDTTGPFGDFMYSVRQIVALYRIDRARWRDISVRYLDEWKYVDDNGRWQALSPEWPLYGTQDDPLVVEYVIEMLHCAIEYRLSRAGHFSRIGRDGKRMWSSGDHACFLKEKGRPHATQGEYDVMDAVDEYRNMVDRALRDWLGNDYEEWEKLPEKEVIPEDLVL